MITLKTLPAATEQEVFDQVAAHLLTQFKRSVDPLRDLYCLYRGKNGLKCAAGCLISDEEYSSGMENIPWRQMVASGKAPEAHRELIIELQKIHDAAPIPNWKFLLQSLAYDRGLNTKVLEDDYPQNAS